MIEPLEPRIAPATFIVTNLDDAGPGSLRSTIDLANDRAGADVIVFQPGLTGRIELTGNEMLITDALTIKGPGPAKLAINGQGLSHILEVRNLDADAPLTVSGLAFFAGSATFPNPDGGAIFSLESLIVRNCVFRGNQAEDDGGAIRAAQGPGNPVNVEISQSSFLHNFTTTSANGGAVDITAGGKVTVKKCLFAGNNSERAGALSIRGAISGSLVRVEQSQFLGNFAEEHGALDISNVGTTIVRGNTFIGNEAAVQNGGAVKLSGGDVLFDRNLVSQNRTPSDGGGLIAFQFDSLTISHSRFLDNTAAGINSEGGALSIIGLQPEGSTVRIVGSVFSGNIASRGGGISVSVLAGLPLLLKISGTAIGGNRATTNGGGIFVDVDSQTSESASVELSSCTITANTAANLGGGVFNHGDGAFTIKSSKVTSNVAAGGGGLHLENTTKTVIVGTLIANNFSATVGGGIDALGELELIGSRMTGNTAGTLGGGIHSVAALLVSGSSVFGNFALEGGGIHQQSIAPLTITTTSKVSGNISNDGKQVVDI